MSLQLNIATYSNERTVLVDGDIVAFRAAAIGGDSFPNCRMAASGLMNKIIEGCDSEDIKIYFTGSENFRYSVYPVYKANRTGDKPVHYAATVAYLKNSYEWECHERLEADDEMAVYAKKYGYDNVVIATIDKDLLQVPTNHYDFIRNRHRAVTPVEGKWLLYMQMLTGDRTDNIPGIRGYGPKKSEKALYIENCDYLDEEDAISQYRQLAWSVYVHHYGNVEDAREAWRLNMVLLRMYDGEPSEEALRSYLKEYEYDI